MKLYLALLISVASLVATSTVFARGGGGAHSVGLDLMIMSPSQDDLDQYITAVGSIDKFGSAYEYGLNYEYRFSGTMFSMSLKPTIFSQSTKGANGSVKLTGYTFFPMLRLYPLENNFIRFFLQVGLGYGSLGGTISETSGYSSTFSGSAFGALGGLGAAFCFTESHCMIVQGNLRYLPIQRNLVSTSSGTLSTGLSQGASNQELEIGGNDLKTTMSGIQGSVGYQLVF